MTEIEEPMVRFFGAATVGRHGQIVIPAQARRELGMNLGTKLLVLSGPKGQGMFLVKAETLQQFINLVTTRISQIGQAPTTSPPPNAGRASRMSKEKAPTNVTRR